MRSLCVYEFDNFQNLNEMPAEPTYHSISGNLTAADAFLNFARVKDDEIAQHTAFGASIGWHAWSATRRVLPLLQKQYRNEVSFSWI